jgi:hypothetical protein
MQEKVVLLQYLFSKTFILLNQKILDEHEDLGEANYFQEK